MVMILLVFIGLKRQFHVLSYLLLFRRITTVVSCPQIFLLVALVVQSCHVSSFKGKLN